MLNKQEFTDPIVRLKNNYSRLSKSLKEIFKDQFFTDEILYSNLLLNNQEYLNIRMHLILTNLNSLFQISKNEDALNALLTLLSQKMDITERHKFLKEK